MSAICVCCDRDPEACDCEPKSAPDARLRLSAVDMLKLELEQQRALVATQAVGMKALEMRLEDAESRALQYTQTIRRFERERELAMLRGIQAGAIAGLETLKASLGPCYGVTDWAKVTYDDVTGEITPLPED